MLATTQNPLPSAATPRSLLRTTGSSVAVSLSPLPLAWRFRRGVPLSQQPCLCKCPLEQAPVLVCVGVDSGQGRENKPQYFKILE